MSHDVRAPDARQVGIKRRAAGWASAERERFFDALLKELRRAALPAKPQPEDYLSHRILILRGARTWLRYFVVAMPSPSRLELGLYVPKGKHGEAVHVELIHSREALARSLGGPIQLYKDVQREFRHFVSINHEFREDTVGSGVHWCLEKLRALRDFIDEQPTLLDSKALLAAHADFVQPTEDTEQFERAVALLLSMGEMKEPAGNEKPPRRPTKSGERVVRCPKVAAYAHQRANGKCEACGSAAPFRKADGRPFLEVHHLHRLADDGPDVPRNTIAACPNCHRRLHYGDDNHRYEEEIRQRLFC